MNEQIKKRTMTRVTCIIHEHLATKVLKRIEAAGVKDLYVTNGRSLRKHVSKRFLTLSGLKVKYLASPTEVFQFSVPHGQAENLMAEIICDNNLENGGSGSIFSQTVDEFSNREIPELSLNESKEQHFLNDLFCITVILSLPQSSELCSRLTLDLGFCVPFINYGKGTGFRDKLGLLRITIPSQKELVTLLVAQYDVNECIRLLTEGLKLDNPGRGFIYSTPVCVGLVDTRIQTGYQKYAASIEQIIAAIDKLYKGARWRQRFTNIDHQSWEKQLIYHQQELSLICSEGNANALIRIATDAGATGATSIRMRRLAIGSSFSGSAACELNKLIIPKDTSYKIIDAIVSSDVFQNDNSANIQLMSAPSAYTYRP